MKKILCISSYSYSFPTVPDQLDGLADGLKGVSTDITYEFMDAKNYFTSEDIENFYDYLKYKVKNGDDYDLVVLCDDTALHFGMNYSKELFPDAPMVFMAVNNITDAETADARDGVTGVAETLDFASNAELFKKLFPERDHITVVLDNSNTAQGEYVEFRKFADEAGYDYDVINASYYSKKGLQEAFQSIDMNTTVMFLDMNSDGEGNSYTVEEAAKLLSENAPNVPITRVTIADVENGVLGGISYSYYDAGIQAGRIASRILKGEDANSIAMVKEAVTKPYFEQSQMDAFGIRERDLPTGTVILNQRQTPMLFYRQNTTMMNLILLVIFMMIGIIAILVVSNRKRQQLIHQDFMTKIPNRTYITERLEEIISQKSPFGLIMMDVDHFKSINDNLGHLVGDELLIEVARRLKSLPKDKVIFARIGGDEFMGFINGCDLEETNKLCSEVMEKMHGDFDLSCGRINITTSMGAALFPKHTREPENVQGLADSALYDVKESGRDGYKIFAERDIVKYGR